MLGLLARYVGLGSLGASTTIMAAMDPHLMLLLFLPPLIFESGFSVE